MEELHRLPVEEQLAFVHRRFRDYEGLYELDA